MDTHNHIEEREHRAGQIRAFIRGTCIRVQDLVIDHERFGHAAEEIAQDCDSLIPDQVKTALAYAETHRAEIDQAIRDDETFTEQKQRSGEAE